MKAALIIDLPKNCAHCPLEIGHPGSLWYDDFALCVPSNIITDRERDKPVRPDWCPLEIPTNQKGGKG